MTSFDSFINLSVLPVADIKNHMNTTNFE